MKQFEIDTRTEKEKDFCSFIETKKFNGKIYHHSIYLDNKEFELNEKQETFLKKYLSNGHIQYVQFDENKNGFNYRYSVMLTQEGVGVIDSIFTYSINEIDTFLNKYNLRRN